jgi:hypothetical protein
VITTRGGSQQLGETGSLFVRQRRRLVDDALDLLLEPRGANLGVEAFSLFGVAEANGDALAGSQLSSLGRDASGHG